MAERSRGGGRQPVAGLVAAQRARPTGKRRERRGPFPIVWV